MENAVIVGVHGLLNKPEKETLESWWRAAIEEGLRLNHNQQTTIPFELAYWADIRNAVPIPLAELEESYESATGVLKRYESGVIDKIRILSNKYGGRFFDKEKELFGLGKNVEHVLDISVEDLAEYYQKEHIRHQIRGRLVDVLSQHQDKKILLLAHSMGSIIAYDVLRMLEANEKPSIDHFVTLGSPLGLPIVGVKNREEFGQRQTPENVKCWTNISDPGDKVAIDCTLKDEYTGFNGVHVEDVLVHNEYTNNKGKANNHKSYGYLRCPEMADRVKAFLEGE